MSKNYLVSVLLLVMFVSLSCSCQESVGNNSFQSEKIVANNASNDNTFYQTFFHNHLIDFKNDEKSIRIFVDKEMKSTVQTDINEPRVVASFVESGNAYFVLVVSSAADACGDGSFVIAKLSEDTAVKLSDVSKPSCNGEDYKLGIESFVTKNKLYSRQIIINSLRFDVEKFDWVKNK